MFHFEILVLVLIPLITVGESLPDENSFLRMYKFFVLNVVLLQLCDLFKESAHHFLIKHSVADGFLELSDDKIVSS